MAEKSTIAKMYDDLVKRLDGIVERKFIFSGGRPDIKDADLGDDEEIYRRRAACQYRRLCCW